MSKKRHRALLVAGMKPSLRLVVDVESGRPDWRPFPRGLLAQKQTFGEDNLFKIAVHSSQFTPDTEGPLGMNQKGSGKTFPEHDFKIFRVATRDSRLAVRPTPSPKTS
jgi:hypothetical protein